MPSQPHAGSQPEPDAPRSGDAAADQPVVSLRDLHKRFGSLVVLNGISLNFLQGQTTVVLGPSGSGKSVLLKHIVGLLRPDKGEVWFRGRRVDSLSERDLGAVRRQIGFLFQLSALFDSMTVLENLSFPLEEHTEFTAAQRRDRVKESLALVDLHGVEDKYPAQLSGGQQRRVALARATMLRPSVMLYDEPTTGLDPIRADGISELILKLQRELSATSIVVTHDLVCTRKVADRMVILRDGRVLTDGPPNEVERSSNRHVQNFLHGRYEPDETDTNSRTDSAGVTGAGPAARRAP